MERIVEFSDALIGPRGRFIDFDGALHIESLVRALVVKLVNEDIELGLLLKEKSRTPGRPPGSSDTEEVQVIANRSVDPVLCDPPFCLEELALGFEVGDKTLCAGAEFVD